MRNFKKSSMLAVAGLAAAATAAMASPASASVYAFFNVANNDPSGVSVTQSGLTWSGRYTTQLPTTITAGSDPSGTLANAFTTGSSSITFTYSYADNPADNCLFTLNMDNATGAITVSGKVQHGAAICTSTSPPSNPVNWTIAR